MSVITAIAPPPTAIQVKGWTRSAVVGSLGSTVGGATGDAGRWAGITGGASIGTSGGREKKAATVTAGIQSARDNSLTNVLGGIRPDRTKPARSAQVNGPTFRPSAISCQLDDIRTPVAERK